jgi:hypothetical protein
MAGRSTPKAVIAPLATAQMYSITRSCMSKWPGGSSSSEKPPTPKLATSTPIVKRRDHTRHS